MQNEINISLSKEHEKYIPEIADTFKGLNVNINPDVYRFSSGELAIQIILYLGGTILSGITYDLLKEGIKRFYSKFTNSSTLIDTNIGVKFLVNKDLTIKAIVIPERENEFINIKNIEDLFNYMSKQSGITKPGYKNIPHLGDIPEDWEYYELEELFDFYKGQGLSKDKLISNGNNECILYGELYTTYKQVINEVKSKTNSNEGIKSIYGDILIPASTTTSAYDLATASVVNNNNVLLGGDINILRKKNYEINGEYYSNYLTYSKKKEISRYGQGITIIHLYAKSFSKILVHYPPINEQQKIARILNTCDNQIETTKQIIQKIELRNKGLQLHLLNGKVRLPGFSEKWHTLELDECLNYSPRPVDKPSENFFALGVRSHGKGIFHKNDFDPEDIAIDTLYEVKEDDLIVNITFAWEQAIAIANKIDDGGLVSHRFPTYTFKLDKAIHRYFRYLIIQKRFKYMLDQISPGGAGRNRVLSKKDFLKLEVKIPKVEEQKAIADVLDKATEQLNEYKTKLEKLELQKKGLMQQLLTGKTRVKI